MTRERIDELVSLVLEARDKNSIAVSIEIEKYDERITVFTEKPVWGVTFTTYSTDHMYDEEGRRTIHNGSCLHVYDADLKKAETRIRRLIDDVDR